jgi:hypothetical protein
LWEAVTTDDSVELTVGGRVGGSSPVVKRRLGVVGGTGSLGEGGRQWRGDAWHPKVGIVHSTITSPVVD